jgi:hypothetical protein
VRYAFIREHAFRLPVLTICGLMEVHPSGYYAWLKQPKSNRSKADEHLTGMIKQFWLESGGVYGYRKIHRGFTLISRTPIKRLWTRPWALRYVSSLTRKRQVK